MVRMEVLAGIRKQAAQKRWWGDIFEAARTLKQTPNNTIEVFYNIYIIDIIHSS